MTKSCGRVFGFDNKSPKPCDRSHALENHLPHGRVRACGYGNQLFNDSVIENATGLDVHLTSQRMESFLNNNELLEAPHTATGKASHSKRLPIWL